MESLEPALKALDAAFRSLALLVSLIGFAIVIAAIRNPSGRGKQDEDGPE